MEVFYIMIYTVQKSKLSKKQREKRDQLLSEQRAIKRSLSSKNNFKPLSVKYDNPRLTDQSPSRPSSVGSALKKEDLYYTGTNMIGIGTLHKSNAVPVFKSEEAKELSSMRR